MSETQVHKTPHNLAFKIAKISSEDRTMHAKDLLQLGPGVKGWACSKYSSYPQELIFQLIERSKLTEIQLLAHQHMIPEQIDIFIGDVQPGKEYASHTIKYAQLGHVFMSNNEHTQFSGRELKYINVSCVGRFLKLVFQHNHMNKLNIHNQVALVAINIVGYEMEDEVNTAFLDYNTRLEYKKNNANWIVHYGQDLAFSMYVDVYVAKTIKQLQERRAAAKRDNQTDYATKLMTAIQLLQKAGEKLGKLEIEKRFAIDNENFDKAKSKKQQLVEYRIEVYKQLDIDGLLEKGEGKQKPRISKANDLQGNFESPRAQTKTSYSPIRAKASSAPLRAKTSSVPLNMKIASASLAKQKSPHHDLAQHSTPRLRSKRIFVPSLETLSSSSDYDVDIDLSSYKKSQKEHRTKEEIRSSGFHKKKFANIFHTV